MKAYEITNQAGTGRLALVDRPKPAPAHGEILIKVRATSLNYRDLLTVKGGIGPAEVAEVGPGVTRVRVADRVIGIFTPSWISGRPGPGMEALGGGMTDGMLREYAVMHESAVVPVPEHLSYEEAAALPCAA